jgi:hypothetical protein
MNDNFFSLLAKLLDLKNLPEDLLWELWDQHFTRRPKNFSREMLISRISHKMQEAYLDEFCDQQRMQVQARAMKLEARKRRRKAIAQFFTELIPAMGFGRDTISMRKFKILWLSGLARCVEKADGKSLLVIEFPNHSSLVIEPFQAELLDGGYPESTARLHRADR